MIKRLTKHGNSAALVIDRPILEILDITTETDLKLTTDGRRLIIEPLSEKERKARVREAAAIVLKKNDEVFRRLAK